MNLSREIGIFLLGAGLAGGGMYFLQTDGRISSRDTRSPTTKTRQLPPAMLNSPPFEAGQRQPSTAQLNLSAGSFDQAPSMLDLVSRLAPSLKDASTDECLRILRWLPSADSNTLVDPSVLVAVRLVMDRLAVLSPADALDAANGLSPILRAEALPEIMRVWSATAPEEAAAWMTERRGPAFKSGADDARLTAELVRHWAVISASTASEWLAAQPADRQMAGWPSLVRGAPPSDLGSLAVTVEGLPPGAVRTSACGELAQHWARSEPEAACSWAASIAGLEGPPILGMAYSGWAASHPLDAADAASKLPIGSHRDAVIPVIAKQWASTDPQAASDWAAMLPEGKSRSEALVFTLWSFLENNPESASAWMHTHYPPGTNDAISRLAAQHLLPTDPAQAISWAQSIKDPTVRRESVSVVLGSAQP